MIGKKLVVAVVVGVMVLLGVFAQKAEAQYTPQSANIQQANEEWFVNVTNLQIINPTKSLIVLKQTNDTTGVTNWVQIGCLPQSNAYYAVRFAYPTSSTNAVGVTNAGIMKGLLNASFLGATNKMLSFYAVRTNEVIETGITH